MRRSIKVFFTTAVFIATYGGRGYGSPVARGGSAVLRDTQPGMKRQGHNHVPTSRLQSAQSPESTRPQEIGMITAARREKPP